MTRLSLDYGNGRTHETEFVGDLPFNPGDEFDLYGRRWRVTGYGLPRTQRYGAPTMAICEPMTPSPLKRAYSKTGA